MVGSGELVLDQTRENGMNRFLTARNSVLTLTSRKTIRIMADHTDCMPLEPESIRKAHATIERYIHRTPLLTSRTLDRLVSTPSSSDKPAPRLRLYFKCENYQKIGAFKARGAFHALSHLIELLGEDEVRRRGVVTHSSGMRLCCSWSQIIVLSV